MRAGSADAGAVRRNTRGRLSPWHLHAMSNAFRYFNSSPEVIRLVVMMYVGQPLSLRNIEVEEPPSL